MNAIITYTPVHVGLFLSLWLAVICNIFLDAIYGIFGMEVVIWSAVLAVTTWIGWRQRVRPWAAGPKIRKFFLVLAFLAFVFVFLPTWFFPRGVVYFLAALQAANNCMPLTRKNLYYGLVIAVSMVMFASAHWRADWAMLFYMAPFLVAVVFTLIAEQVSHHAAEFKARSVGSTAQGREWVAIVSASAGILLLSAALYALVPQTSWRQLEWRYGAPAAGEIHPGNGQLAAGKGTDGRGGQGNRPRSVWISPGKMREMAGQDWMPRWQAAAMMKLADMSEAWTEFSEPKIRKVRQWLDSLWEMLKSIFDPKLLMLLLVLALLISLLVFTQEIRPLAWCRTRWDYLRFGVFRHDGRSGHAAIDLYRVMEKLFDYYDNPRPATYNSWEYLQNLRAGRSHLRPELALLTLAFESARYGRKQDSGNPDSLRSAYRKIYRDLNR